MNTNDAQVTDPEEPLKPFIIENEGPPANGRAFRPRAAVRFTSALRTSGLLHALEGDDLKSLLFVLTFLHANGWCQPTIFELAHAMRVSEPRARRRLGRLTEIRWKGNTLLTELSRESGMDGYAPSPHIVEQTVAPAIDTTPSDPPIVAAGRDAVVALSRERYARPRAEVERDMAIQNGWPLPEEIEAMHQASPIEEDADHAGARRRLLGLNVPRNEVDRLLSTYPIERVLQQLLWLPSRNAKSKSRFIVAAIDGDYEEPRR